MKSVGLYIYSLIFFSFFISCKGEESGAENNSKTQGYSFFADILDFEDPGLSTRAQTVIGDDFWRIKNFDRGDIAGFYSLYGNSNAPDGNGSFNNEPLSFNGSIFTNENVIFNTDYFKAGTTFYYYPYCPNVDYDPDHSSWAEEDDYGIELRVKDADEIDKCRDLLWVINATSATTASFGHATASIVFLREEGFKKAKNRTIKVVLNKGVSHAVVEDNKDYLKNLRFIYLDGYKRDKKSLSEEECKSWYAWEGNSEYPYQVNDENSIYNQRIYEDAQYIILPTSRPDSRLKVDHIEVYDDNDDLKIITNFTLYGSDKTLYYRHRYPLIIKMQGLEATVVPVSIRPWGEDVNIVESRDAGIDNSNFNKWVLSYNQYIESNRSPKYEEELQKYGDQLIINGVTSWKFYLNSDIDLYGKIDENQKNILEKFADFLDGNNHVISGLNMSCSTPPAMIGTLESSAVIQNLDIEGMMMTCTSRPNEEHPESAGGLCGKCYGTIDHCNIDGVIQAEGRSVGMIAGYAENAVVQGCVLTGLISGTVTVLNGKFGEASGVIDKSGNNCSGLIFINSIKK